MTLSKKMQHTFWSQNFVFLILLALFLRASTLNVQSFWLDEVYTAHVVHGDFSGLWGRITATENTPPLYYYFAWFWGQLFGFREVGLRSISVFAGVFTVGVVYRMAFVFTKSEQAAFVAAFLTAVNPYLVWFSQEARAYSVAILLATLSLWALAQILKEQTLLKLEDEDSKKVLRRWRLLWGFFACCLLLTSYYGLLVVFAEAAWLFIAAPKNALKRFFSSLVLPFLGLAIILPLGFAQQQTGSYTIQKWGGSLLYRLVQTPKQFAVGWDGPLQNVFGFLICLVFGVFLLGLFRVGKQSCLGRYIKEMGLLLVVVGAVPVIAATFGFDAVLSRYYLLFWPVVVFLLAVGACGLSRKVAYPAVGIVGLISLATITGVAANPQYQRDDWRGFTHALGSPKGQHVVALNAKAQQLVVQYYRPKLHSLVPKTRVSADVLVVASWGSVSREEASQLPPELATIFQLQSLHHTDQYTVARYQAKRPFSFSSTSFQAMTLFTENCTARTQC